MAYYLAPRFLDKLSVHITKNYLNIPAVKVPLILGVHGRKGEGKSFQCELVFDRMGVHAIHMSAGELESPDAGDPARLIRLRYREAAESVKVNGKMAVLMINDIDAGMGRIDQFTQYTVNTQLVAGTLMNIADNPTNVQLPGSYDAEPIQRIPIIVTGNDFSTLYAPLIRDGRMEKFYWEPDRSDRIGIVNGIFASDRVPPSDIEKLVDTFPDQSIDFYSALHSRLYDEQVRQLIQKVGIDRVSLRVVNSKEAPPEFRQPDFRLNHLIELGELIVREQQRIQELRLVQSYNNLDDRNSGNRDSSRPNSNRPNSNRPNSSHSGLGDRFPNHNEATKEVAAYSQSPVAQSGQNGGSAASSYSPNNSIPSEALRTLQDLLDRQQRVGIEVVDRRRFRTNSWQGYSMLQPNSSFEAAKSTLANCFAEHDTDYIRLIGINPGDRRRTAETIVHRPE